MFYGIPQRYKLIGSLQSPKYLGLYKYRVDYGSHWTEGVIASSEEEAINRTTIYTYYWKLKDSPYQFPPIVTVLGENN